MAIITVSYDGENLEMSDRGDTKARRNEQILWQPGDGVKAITNVSAKPKSPVPTEKFWSNAPHENGVNFKGTINSNVEDGGAWDYDITCNIGTIKDPVSKKRDPRIQVYSR